MVYPVGAGAFRREGRYVFGLDSMAVSLAQTQKQERTHFIVEMLWKQDCSESKTNRRMS